MIHWRKKSPGECDTQVGTAWHHAAEGEVLVTPDDVILDDENWERLPDPAPKTRTKPAAAAAEED